MWFVSNFEKIANFDHNNQGMEFQMADQSPGGNPNANAAGKAPTGFPSYQPVNSLEVDKPKKGKKISDVAAAQFLFGKLSAVDSVMASGGTAGDSGADTLVSQLKWTSDKGSDYHEGIGDNRERKTLAKRFAKFRKSSCS